MYPGKGYYPIENTKEKTKMILKAKAPYLTWTMCYIKQHSFMTKDGTDCDFQKWRKSLSALSKEVTCEIVTETSHHLSICKTLAREHRNVRKRSSPLAPGLWGFFCFLRKGTIPKVVSFFSFFFWLLLKKVQVRISFCWIVTNHPFILNSER